MSRTPPASIRLTGGYLNYNQVAISAYYFQSHLKEGIVLENIVRMLASNVGFFTSLQKRKNIPLLVMGVLPIYTQLRAKKCYYRYLTKSAHWFSAKLFRGAQSDILQYHNASLYHESKSAAEQSLVKRVSHDSISRALQKLINLTVDWKKALTVPETLQFGCYKGRLLKSRSQNHSRRYLHIADAKIVKVGQTAVLESFFTVILHKRGTSIAVINPLCELQKKSSWISSPQRSRAQASQLRGEQTFAKSRRISQQRKSVWSKKSLFVLFCLEQIVGKTNQNASCHLQGVAYKPITTKGYKNQRNKKFKTFYDMMLIQQLESDDSLKLLKGHNIPKSQIDKLKPKYIEPVSSSRYTQNKTLKRDSRNFFDSTMQSKMKPTKQVKLLDFDRYVCQYKSNVVPKFWVNRRFHLPMRLNLFSIIEGRICGERRANSPFLADEQKRGAFQISRFQPSDTAGWARLKSGFVFEFNVHSKTSDDVKSLKPTVSLRF